MKRRKELSPFEKLVKRIENAAYDARLELFAILEIQHQELAQHEVNFILGYLAALNKMLAFADSASKFPTEQRESYPVTLSEYREYFKKGK